MSWARAGRSTSNETSTEMTRVAANAITLRGSSIFFPPAPFGGRETGMMHEPAALATAMGKEALRLGAAVLLAFLADALDGDHALVVGRIEHDHPLGRASGDADAFDPGADELATVGDQHQLVAVLDRERGDQLAGLLADAAVALAHVHCHDAFAAAAGDPVFVGRRSLAVAALRDREHELLGRRHLYIALLAELDRAGDAGLGRVLCIGCGLLGIAVEATPHRVGALEIGHALIGGRVHVAQDRQRDQLVALGQRDAADAHGGAALEHAYVGDGETDALAARGGEQHIVPLRALLHVEDGLALVELHGDDAGTANITSSSPHVDSSSGNGMTVVTSSPCSSGRMLISALPRACGAACGNRQT